MRRAKLLSPNRQALVAELPKGLLAGLPLSRRPPRVLSQPGSQAANGAGASFKVGKYSEEWRVDETRRLVSEVLSEAQRIGMSKGRYERFIAQYMALELGIEEPGSSKSAPAGTISIDDKQTPYAFMRDAEIPEYISRGPLRAGFAGFHQIYGARAVGGAPGLRDVPLIRHPSARFVLAAHPEQKDALIQKLLNGETVTLATEYVPLAKRIASERAWSVNFYQSGKGMAEIDAGHHPGRFDGVVAIADTEDTLHASGLDVIKGFDHLAPVDIHFVWSADLRVSDPSLYRQNDYPRLDIDSLEAPARQARLNRWLDGRQAERIQAMLAAPNRRGRVRHPPDRE